MKHRHRALWIAFADPGFPSRDSQQMCLDGGVN